MTMNWKKHFTVTNSIIFIVLAGLILYTVSFIFPVTDDAFVVSNIRPVVAEVEGYISEIYVKNGDQVKKGQPLFKVLDDPYRYDFERSQAQLKKAKAKLRSLAHQLNKDVNYSQNLKAIYEKIALDDEKYQAGFKANVVSKITAQDSLKDTKAARANYRSSINQIEIDEENIVAEEHNTHALEAVVKKAKFYLEQTVVYAQDNGIIQNFYLALGNPVNFNEPLFSFVTTDDVIIQANFNETDLRLVQPGDDVLIFPRTYLFQKIYHGKIISGYWSVNRQETNARTQLQHVANENQWLLLPQRLPIQIRVTDADPDYPLRVGSSVYVYIDV
ncbi:MAG: multidrug resistance efflux pump [Francisellaceae bacterium]|jgi:multidrug resistance efflux pump